MLKIGVCFPQKYEQKPFLAELTDHNKWAWIKFGLFNNSVQFVFKIQEAGLFGNIILSRSLISYPPSMLHTWSSIAVGAIETPATQLKNGISAALPENIPDQHHCIKTLNLRRAIDSRPFWCPTWFSYRL